MFEHERNCFLLLSETCVFLPIVLTVTLMLQCWVRLSVCHSVCHLSSAQYLENSWTNYL